MADLEIMCEPLGSLGTNCYFVYKKDTKETIIFDPADNFMRIKRKIDDEGLKVVAVFLTHGHYDHFLAADEIRKFYNVKIYIGANDYELVKDATMNVSALFGSPATLIADEKVEDKELLDISGIKFRAINTPGHTKGGMCYYFYENGFLISGDTLFCNSYGRYDLPTGNIKELIHSIRDIILELPQNTIVLPGHGEDTTILDEQNNNSQWRK